jgi:hypothetical protein
MFAEVIHWPFADGSKPCNGASSRSGVVTRPGRKLGLVQLRHMCHRAFYIALTSIAPTKPCAIISWASRRWPNAVKLQVGSCHDIGCNDVRC